MGFELGRSEENLVWIVLRQADTRVIRDLHVFKLKQTFFFSQQDAANLYLNMDAVQADILATNIVNIPADCLAKGKTSLTGMLFAVMGKSLQETYTELYIQFTEL